MMVMMFFSGHSVLLAFRAFPASAASTAQLQDRILSGGVYSKDRVLDDCYSEMDSSFGTAMLFIGDRPYITYFCAPLIRSYI